jgi:hypothetical protein
MMATQEETRAALVKSIEHWRELEVIDHMMRANIGPRSCALCKLFSNHFSDPSAAKVVCGDCPVRLKTRYHACRRTPYLTAAKARTLTAFRIAAKAEREFLESLLAEMDAKALTTQTEHEASNV